MGASNATPLTMRTSPAPREFSSVQLDFQGPPGVPVLLAIDAQPFPLYLAAAKSSVLIPAPPVIFTLGVTSPAGVLHFVFPTRRNLAGQGVPYYAQAAYLDPAGGGVLGTGSMLLLLDEDY